MILAELPAAATDVHFPRHSHAERMMGCLARQTRFGGACPTYRDALAVIPRSEWADRCRERVKIDPLVRIKDQNGEGTCTANAGTQAGQICWARQFGLEHYIEFSPISTYKFCAPGPGTGSSLDCNLKRMRDHGMIPVDTAESRERLRAWGLPESHVLKPVGYSQRITSEMLDTAQQFRAEEFFDIDSFDEFFSALLLYHTVWYGRAGHSILAVEPVYVESSRSFAVRYANSWGDWGERGYGYDSEAFLKRSYGAYGAFAVRTMRTPKFLTKDLPPPLATAA